MTNEATLTPEIVLNAYASGVFPMGEARDDDRIYWVEPESRGILPLDAFHISRSLAKRLKSGDYRVTVNAGFAGVVAACADRKETWINGPIRNIYAKLHDIGFAHSLEVWQGGRLSGGIYGVAIGAAFFGESMFSRIRDGSKIAIAHLVERLVDGGFELFDVQFVTDHLATLGAKSVPRHTYRRMLSEAIKREARLPDHPSDGESWSKRRRDTRTP